MIKQTIDSYVKDTILSHTRCFPAQMEQTAVIGYAEKNRVRRLDHADLSQISKTL